MSLLEKAQSHVHRALGHTEHSEQPAFEARSESHHSYKHHEDRNQINQQDEHYQSLRTRASQEGNLMAQAFDRSHRAYESGDGALAKELSNEGKTHERDMEALNAQASDWIFAANNKDMPPGEVNLHGLYVKEAITHTERAIQDAQRRKYPVIQLVVGKGIHSPGHIAKIKPAIEDLMQKYQLMAELDPHNEGVLIVHLDGKSEQSGRSVGAEDLAHHLERGDEGCCLM